jgi:hypothetical protein
MTVSSLHGGPAASHSFLYMHFKAIVLICCWCLVQFFLFSQYGIHTDLEARKYIFEAKHLLSNGTVSSPNFWLYSTQIWLIAVALKLKAGFFSVYLVQLFFNAYATCILYKFIFRISNRKTAFIITLFFILNIPLQTFNSFLQTESLFQSFTILFSCYLLTLKKLNLRSGLFLFFFLVLIVFTRPTGLLYVPCTFLYLFFRFARSLSLAVRISATLTASIGFLFLLNTALGSGGELDFMLPFRDERIICGVPTLPYFRDIRISDNPNSLFGIIYYITHNLEQFTRLAWLRTKAFLGLSRSYYSTGHNLYLYIYFFPFYLFALLGIRKWITTNKCLLLYCLSPITLTWCTVILTCDDWHNRFFLSVVPYIYILSTPVVQAIMDKFNRNDSKRSI